MKSDGMPWRPLVHIEDIARAFLAIAEAPRELDPRRGVQRRPHERELPDPRRRPDRRGGRPRQPGHLRRRRQPRPAQLPRRLRPVSPSPARLPAHVDRARRGRAAVRGLPASYGLDLGGPDRAPPDAHPRASRQLLGSGSLGRQLARSRGAGRWPDLAEPPLPLLRHSRAGAASCRSATRRWPTPWCAADRLGRAGERASRWTSPSARSARSCRSSRTCRPRRALRRRLPLLLLVLSATCSKHAGEHALGLIEQPRAWVRTAWSWSSPATTATCCATSSRPGSRCSASSRRPGRRRRRRRRASRPWSILRDRDLADRLRAERGAGRRHHRQQRDGSRA